MPERGGPTTQSGILYQNSIAALYLGRMVDPAPRPKHERVAEVRVEAPTEVDDIVVTFEDGHVAYIQAKENTERRGEVWVKLWKSLEAQSQSPDFKERRGSRGDPIPLMKLPRGPLTTKTPRHAEVAQRRRLASKDASEDAPEVQRGDRLVLHLGLVQTWHRSLKELCERAGTSKTDSEWRQRLSKALVEMLDSIARALGVPAESDALLPLLRSVDVEILSYVESVRDLASRWMPESNSGPSLLFDKLLHLDGEGSAVRRPFDAAWLLDRLENEGVRIKGPNEPKPRRAPFMAADIPPSFVPRPEEYEELVTGLLGKEHGGSVAITAALKGAGGYGKTTPAMAVCHDPRIM